MRIMFILCGMAVFSAGQGQNVIDVDKNPPARLSNQLFFVSGGQPFSTAKYVKLTSGSPYFSETWMKGTVFITDSTKARNVRMRLDLFDGSLIYLNDRSEEMISTLPVVQVSMTDTLTGNQYIFLHSSVVPGAPSNKIWYRVMVGEKFTLLKEYRKTMLESKPYGSSVTEQTIKTDEKYYIGFNNTVTQVKKLNEIAELAGNKKQALLEYIEKNKLSHKKEADFIALVVYYHSLK